VSVHLDDGDVVLHLGDALDILCAMPGGSVDCVVTSPPYYGLRDYGIDGQIGLEDTPDAFIERLMDVFTEVRRVLADHGTCWVNMGDSYNSDGRKGRAGMGKGKNSGFSSWMNKTGFATKPKDLLMMPARVALALQAYGWWLRSDIIWSKPNPMPESVRDRPTSAHEHIFLLTKTPRYYWDAEAVREPDGGKPSGNGFKREHRLSYGGRGDDDQWTPGGGRNVRNVWTMATEPTPEAHFATFPTELVRRCLAAGCKPGGVVLDPFIGSGTTAKVARSMGLRAVGIDLNPEYLEIAAKRLNQLSLFAPVMDVGA